MLWVIRMMAIIRHHGSHWPKMSIYGPVGSIPGIEGPRRIGWCVYCAGPCEGVTLSCETRVWQDAKAEREKRGG